MAKTTLKIWQSQRELKRGMRACTGEWNVEELWRIHKHDNDGCVTDERRQLLPPHADTSHTPWLNWPSRESTGNRRITQGVMTEVQHDGEEASRFDLWPPRQFILGRPLTFREKNPPCATVRKSFFMGESAAQEANDQLTSRLGENVWGF